MLGMRPEDSAAFLSENEIELEGSPRQRHLAGFDPLLFAHKTTKGPKGLLENLVEHRGIEPLTSGLQSPRSPS